MAVGEGDFEGVVAGGLQVGDADAGFAGLQFSLPVALGEYTRRYSAGRVYSASG